MGKLPRRWIRGGQLALTLVVLTCLGLWVEREAGGLSWAMFVPVPGREGWLLIALLLVPLNLGLETRKWLVPLRQTAEPMPFATAWRAVWAGVTTGLFTPNRIGEYGGRLLFVPAAQRWAALAYTWVGRLAQMLATLLTGGAAWLFLASGPGLPFPQVRALVVGSPLVWAAGSLALGAALTGMVWWGLPRLRLFARWRALGQAWGRLSTYLLIHMTGWALLRYAVFATQSVCLLYVFGGESVLPLSYAVVALAFWVRSLIPSITLSELGIRESVALAVMVPYGWLPTTVLAASFTLFALNLLLPALVGLLFILRIRPGHSPDKD